MPLQSPWVKAGWAGTALLTCVVVTVIVAVAFSQRAADGWVHHTLTVERTLRVVQSDIEGATGEVRTYALTGREGWISSFHARLDVARGSLRRLEDLVSDNPEQEERALALEAWLGRHSGWLESVIKLGRDSGPAAAAAEMAGGRSDSDEAALVGRISEMYSVEEALLGSRLAQLASLRHLSLGLEGLLIAIVTLQVAISWRLLRQRQEAERHTREMTEKARAYAESLVDTLREPVLVLETDLRARSANRSFCLTFKTEPAQLQGRPLAELQGGIWNAPELAQRLAGALDDRPFDGFALEADVPGLGRRHLLLNGRKVYRPGNHTGLVLLTIEDDTDRAAAEARIRQVNAELEGFAYSVAHDLRAPLRAMQGFSGALVEDFGEQLGDVGKGYTTHIAEAAARMDRLIRDLLDYSRLARSQIEPSTVALDDAVGAARQQIAAEVAATGAEVSVDGPLPSVRGHAATLVQVLANLMGNACKFVPRGTAPRVRVRAERKEKRVRLWVEDNGIGIAPEHFERIFGVFERLHGQEEYAGTGIGLAIVRKGMERQGGRAGVESSPGAGARFWIELPAAAA